MTGTLTETGNMETNDCWNVSFGGIVFS